MTILQQDIWLSYYHLCTRKLKKFKKIAFAVLLLLKNLSIFPLLRVTYLNVMFTNVIHAKFK